MEVGEEALGAAALERELAGHLAPAVAFLPDQPADPHHQVVVHLQPLLRDPRVEFVGEIGEGEKQEFLGNALALLFPIDWPEPFGLVMIEALACGTPVIAYRRGSVTEVLDDGEVGFVVTDLESAAEAAAKVAKIDRRRCREVFEERFTAARMAADYMALYERLVQGEAHGAR